MEILRRKKRPRVLIVGANFGGLSAAKSLPGSFRATVLDPWPYFEFSPNIHELVSRIKSPRDLRLSKRKIVEAAGHRFVQDRAATWRPEENCVRTESGLEIPYDYAVCAVGGVSNFFNTPGAREIAFDFKSVENCHAIGKTLAANMRSGKPCSIVIAGGGIEGVEALGEVLRRYGDKPGTAVHLVEGRDRVLSFGPPGLHDAVVGGCRTMPVLFHMGTSIKRVAKDAVELSNGGTIPADMTIWTGGVKPLKDLAPWGLANESGQWAPVNEFLQSPMHPEIFVAGDSAGLITPLGKQAYHAMDMGVCAAQNIIRLSKGGRPRKFKPSPKPTLVAFGALDAFLVAESITLAGPALSFAKEAVYQNAMHRFDPAWKPARAAHTAARLTRAGLNKALSYALSPKDLIQLGNFRVIR